MDELITVVVLLIIVMLAVLFIIARGDHSFEDALDKTI